MWSVVSLYYTDDDHHKVQTGRAIWPSLRPSPGALGPKALVDGGWGVGGGFLLWTLYDGCFLEVNRALPQWIDSLIVPPYRGNG